MPMQRAYHKLPKGATQKLCVDCGRMLPLNSFYKVGTSYTPRCKECARAQRKEVYQANRDKQNGQAKKLYADKIGKYKTPCVICGESRPWAIDLHHIDPAQKLFGFGGNVAGHTTEELEAEAAKCVCICSNCHRDFHHTYGANPVNPVQAWDEYYRVHKRDVA